MNKFSLLYMEHDGVPADFWKEAIDSLRQAAGPRKIVMLAEGKRSDNFTVGGFDMNYGWDYKDKLVEVFNGASAEELNKADKEFKLANTIELQPFQYLILKF